MPREPRPRGTARRGAGATSADTLTRLSPDGSSPEPVPASPLANSRAALRRTPDYDVTAGGTGPPCCPARCCRHRSAPGLLDLHCRLPSIAVVGDLDAAPVLERLHVGPDDVVEHPQRRSGSTRAGCCRRRSYGRTVAPPPCFDLHRPADPRAVPHRDGSLGVLGLDVADHDHAGPRSAWRPARTVMLPFTRVRSRRAGGVGRHPEIVHRHRAQRAAASALLGSRLTADADDGSFAAECRIVRSYDRHPGCG